VEDSEGSRPSGSRARPAKLTDRLAHVGRAPGCRSLVSPALSRHPTYRGLAAGFRLSGVVSELVVLASPVVLWGAGTGSICISMNQDASASLRSQDGLRCIGLNQRGGSLAEIEAGTARQYLSSELSRLRRMAGLGGRELAAQIGISQSKLSRIEAGATVPTMPEVMAWADAVNTSNEVRDHLIQLTEAAYTDIETWRVTFRAGRRHIQDDTRMYETTARTIRNFHPAIVPGLLQTAEYTRRVLTLAETDPVRKQRHDRPAAVAGRVQRQEALYDKTRQFDFLITEAALRWQSHDSTLILPQLDRIATIATLDNVWIGLLPSDVAIPGVPEHNFQLYEDRDDDQEPVVRIEMLHARVLVSNPQDVAVYRDLFASWRTVAIHGDEAQEFLQRLGNSIRER
jgi:transcriptional regulator with XRE-family HTH domain